MKNENKVKDMINYDGCGLLSDEMLTDLSKESQVVLEQMIIEKSKKIYFLDDINKIIKNVIATLEIEGLSPSKEAIEINKDFLEGKISSDEAITKIKKIHNIKGDG